MGCPSWCACYISLFDSKRVLLNFTSKTNFWTMYLIFVCIVWGFGGIFTSIMFFEQGGTLGHDEDVRLGWKSWVSEQFTLGDWLCAPTALMNKYMGKGYITRFIPV